MPAGSAENYLEEHGDGVAALTAVLADLSTAHSAGKFRDCDFLIDAMNELRILCGMASPSERTTYFSQPTLFRGPRCLRREPHGSRRR